MFSALSYLQVQSVKNRLWQRIKRLRRPRYLVGAAAGAFYLVMMFRRTFTVLGSGDTHPTLGLFASVTTATWEFVAAFALCFGLLLAWIIPHKRAALVFSEPEIAFLFPAPIRRQTLVHYKLVRSQVAVLFTVLFLTVLSRWSGGLVGAVMRAAGWWVLLSTINLHLLGSSFARTLLLQHGISTWRRRVILLTLAVLALGTAMLWVGREVPAATQQTLLSPGAVVDYLNKVAQSAPSIYLLAPFRWVVRPFLVSGDAHAFVRALSPALLLLALHYVWVVRADVAFEEASVEASQRYAARAAALRDGRWQNTRSARPRRDPFQLAPTGSPAVAILWKNLLSAGQMFSSRVGFALLIWTLAVGSGLGLGAGRTAWPQALGSVATVLLVWAVLLGPQFVRQDFRQDLAAADLLKMYPVRGWQMALGELLAPTLILTFVEWVLILLSATLLINGHGEGWSDDPTTYVQTRFSVAISAAILVAPLTMVSLIIPNAAALLLPAWFAGPAGGSSRGVEVMGQRLIFLLAQCLALVVALLPALLAAFLIYELVALPYLPAPAAIPAAAMMAATVLAGEAAGGLAMLGYWFESYDLSSERPV